MPKEGNMKPSTATMDQAQKNQKQTKSATSRQTPSYAVNATPRPLSAWTAA